MNFYMVDFNGYLYQVFVIYYIQDERWDMVLGFRGDNIWFSWLLLVECIICYNYLLEQVFGFMNKYVNMLMGIECECCYGLGEIYVKEKLVGEIIDILKFIDYFIVNFWDFLCDF